MTTPQPPFRVRTIYSWSGAEEDDLGFIEGDIIEVDDLGDGNWWHGRLRRNRMTGNFPSNYVELIKSDFSQGMSRNGSSDKLSGANTPVHQGSYTRSINTTPQSPYSRTQSPQRQEDDMQFSFQSSRSHYDPYRGSSASPHRQTQPPYPKDVLPPVPDENYHLPHSRSVPVKLEQQQQQQQQQYQYQHHSPLRSREATPADDRLQSYTQSRGLYNGPPLPQHSVMPTKSQSSYNLRSHDQTSVKYAPANTTATANPEPPYSRDPRKSMQSSLLKQARQNNMRDSYQSDFVVPYDPETLNQSKSSTSQSSNVFSYSNGSYFTSSQSSTESASFAMSDFSATSAGSYARHKYEDQQRVSISNMKSSASGNHLLVEEKRVKNPSGILKKIFSTKDAPPLPTVDALTKNMEQVAVEDKQMNSWIEFKIDLNRANSLSSKERQLREKRIRETEGYVILEPHKQLSNVNSNECYQTENKIDLNSISLKHVDNFMRKLTPQFSVMSPEAFITNELGMKYSSKLEYLRALFILCAEHFTIVEGRSNDMEKPQVENLFRSKKAKPYEMAYLFKYLSDLMGLKSELISGSLKTPQSIIRHYWNAVLINGEWRFIDVSMGNLSNPIYEILASKPDSPSEPFYFLSEPLDLIFTHIPDKYEHQHIVPPIDPMVARAIPPCFPSFFKNGLKIYKFSNALTKLKDYEIFEIDLKIPKDIEVNAVVMTKTSVTNTLSQVYWKHGDRYCKVKGHLPDNQTTGFVNIFSGMKGSQKSLQNIHPLSMVIPITHEGDYRPLDFVIRYPTVPAQVNDLYIKQPQNRNLAYNAEYVFMVSQHPSNGLTNSPSTRSKIALQSPSGKIIKFVKKDQSTPLGAWELPIKCNEIGVWRGLVSIDSGTSLCVFAEWTCDN